MGELLMVPPAELTANPANLRRGIEIDEDMLASIRAMGVLEPLLARRDTDGSLLITAGHRRLAHVLELDGDAPTALPVMVRDTDADDEDPETIDTSTMLVENLHRKDLTPVEEATGFARLIDKGLKQAEVARLVGRSTSLVSRRVKLLKLPPDALDDVHAGNVPLDLAEAWLSIPDATVRAVACKERWPQWRVTDAIAKIDRQAHLDDLAKACADAGLRFFESISWNEEPPDDLDLPAPPDGARLVIVDATETYTVKVNEHGVPIPEGSDEPAADEITTERDWTVPADAPLQLADAAARPDIIGARPSHRRDGTLVMLTTETRERPSSVDAERAMAHRRAKDAHRKQFLADVVARKHKHTDVVEWLIDWWVNDHNTRMDLYDVAGELLQLDPALTDDHAAQGEEPNTGDAFALALAEASGAAHDRCLVALLVAAIYQWGTYASSAADRLLEAWGFEPLPDPEDA